MTGPMTIAFFGSSLVSAFWNGAATYYRGILQALAAKGHRITFYEPDAYERQQHRDIADPDWTRVVVYPADEAGVGGALEAARAADLLIKASGVGVFDELLEAAVPALRRPGALAAFWDVDAPATVQRDGTPVFICAGDRALKIALNDIPWAKDPASSADPFIRVPQLVKEDIAAELIFPTLSWTLLHLEDTLRSACLRAYNSWIWNIATASPRRFHGVALLPPGAEAVAELQRAATLQLKAAVMPVDSGSEATEIVRAAAAADLPLMLVRPNGPAPFTDFAGFSAACTDLTRQAIAQGAVTKFLIPGAPEQNAPDNVRYITADPAAVKAAPQRAFWGRCGGIGASVPNDAADHGIAAGYFRISF